ncbi:MAG TPA: hypothetical protein VFO10_12855 [Oligoflexus sp.]|uniref:hypothetical protein n=1 Tax=Oligoflexus sp. TaxID=1971216 RepID=UPI002D7E5EF5|nr:hypothetical protein [Oligoflexus sp.]HET9238141.1 hypothetical protein [Oligoflexus sp.]
MRYLLLLLVWSLAAPLVAAPKKTVKKRPVPSRSEDLSMWDGSVADVSWVNENTRSRPAPPSREDRDWLSFALITGHRVFQLDAPMVQTDENRQIITEGQFTDLIETKNSFELRALVHPFTFLSLGATYHTDDSRLKINNETVPIAPQEFLGTVQLGPRFGIVRIYGFYSQILASRSQASITAPTKVGDTQSSPSFAVDVKQSGGEAGLGTQFDWGILGFSAEAVRSVNRTYDLTLTDAAGVKTFQANSKPTFKAWQFGLSLNF